VEAGQASTMAALGATVPPRKDTFQALAAQPLTQAAMACRTGLTKRTAFGLVQARLEVEVPPEVIAHGFLYDWLKTSTAGENGGRASGASGTPEAPAITTCAVATAAVKTHRGQPVEAGPRRRRATPEALLFRYGLGRVGRS